MTLVKGDGALTDRAVGEPLWPSMDDTDETVHTLLTGRLSSEGLVLDSEHQSVTRGS